MGLGDGVPGGDAPIAFSISKNSSPYCMFEICYLIGQLVNGKDLLSALGNGLDDIPVLATSDYDT